MIVNSKYSVIATLILTILLCVVRGNDSYNISRMDVNNNKFIRKANDANKNLLSLKTTGEKRNSIQDKIYSNAKANIGDKSWAKGVRRQAKRNPNVVYDKGVWKCNLFVYEIILASGLDIGTYECSSGITPPVAGDWYNYSSYLITNNAEFIGKGPEGINKAIPGDIITDGIHMGIYAGNDEVINAGLYDVHITNIKTIGNWGNSYGYGYGNNPFKIFRIKPNYQLNSANNIVSIASEDDHNNICDDRCHCNIMDNYYTPNNENISDNNLNSSETENINEIINSLDQMVDNVVENVLSSMNIVYSITDVTYVTPEDGGIWISINAKSSNHLVSAYYHPTKYHYTRVVGKSDPGRSYADPGEWAIAVTNKKEKGNKTFFNVSNCSGSDSCDKDINDDEIDHWMSGSNKLKQLSFFSIFIIFTSILIWQTHIIF